MCVFVCECVVVCVRVYECVCVCVCVRARVHSCAYVDVHEYIDARPSVLCPYMRVQCLRH